MNGRMSGVSCLAPTTMILKSQSESKLNWEKTLNFQVPFQRCFKNCDVLYPKAGEKGL